MPLLYAGLYVGLYFDSVVLGFGFKVVMIVLLASLWSGAGKYRSLRVFLSPFYVCGMFILCLLCRLWFSSFSRG